MFSCQTPTKVGANPEYAMFAVGTGVVEEPISTRGDEGAGVAAEAPTPSGGAFGTGPTPVP